MPPVNDGNDGNDGSDETTANVPATTRNDTFCMEFLPD